MHRGGLNDAGYGFGYNEKYIIHNIEISGPYTDYFPNCGFAHQYITSNDADTGANIELCTEAYCNTIRYYYFWQLYDKHIDKLCGQFIQIDTFTWIGEDMLIQIQKILLILIRITAFIFLCPGFSHKYFPNTIKVALSLGISMLVYAAMPDIQPVGSTLIFMVLIIKETMLGLSLGFVSLLTFGAIEIAGHFIDFQTGYSMATVFDPNTNVSASNYGKFYYWISISVFFILNIHHKVIEILILSFKYLDITQLGFKSINPSGIIILFGRIFEMGFRLAVPMITVILLTDIILGVISRTIPQINVLMLGMPLKSLISAVVFLFILSGIVNYIGKTLGLLPVYLEEMIQAYTY